MTVKELIVKLLACEMDACVMVDNPESPPNALLFAYLAGDSDGTVMLSQFNYPELIGL